MRRRSLNLAMGLLASGLCSYRHSRLVGGKLMRRQNCAADSCVNGNAEKIKRVDSDVPIVAAFAPRRQGNRGGELAVQAVHWLSEGCLLITTQGRQPIDDGGQAVMRMRQYSGRVVAKRTLPLLFKGSLGKATTQGAIPLRVAFHRLAWTGNVPTWLILTFSTQVERISFPVHPLGRKKGNFTLQKIFRIFLRHFHQ